MILSYIMISLSERKLALKWCEEKKSQEEIANLLNCHQSSISRLLKKNKQFKTIQDLPRTGKPTKLTNKNMILLKSKLKLKIEQKNAKFGSVTTKEIREFINQEIGELYSIRHVERIMHKIGFSLITPRTMHTKHDQNAVDEFREEFKKKNSQSIWIMR